MKLNIFFVFTLSVLCSMNPKELDENTEKFLKDNLDEFADLLTIFKSRLEILDTRIRDTIKKQQSETKKGKENIFLNKLIHFYDELKLLFVIVDKVRECNINKLNFDLIAYNEKDFLQDIFVYSKAYKEYALRVLSLLIELDQLQSDSDGVFKFEATNSTIKYSLADFKMHMYDIDEIYFINNEFNYKTGECTIL